MWEMHYSRHKSKYVLHYLYYKLQHVLKMYSLKYTKKITVVSEDVKYNHSQIQSFYNTVQ